MSELYDETFVRVKKVIKEAMYGDDDLDIQLDNHIVDDLGAASMDIVSIVMELEDEFGAEVPEENMQQFTTVRSIVDFIVACSDEQASGAAG